MGVTLKQIADLAGVHKSTVDKVIHNRRASAMPDDSRSKSCWKNTGMNPIRWQKRSIIRRKK